MGAAGKARRHTAKMKAKRAAKTLKAASYAAKRGTSTKAKKLRSQVSKFSATKHKHLIAYCGNIGCSRCHPEFRKLSHKELAARAKTSPAYVGLLS